MPKNLVLVVASVAILGCSSAKDRSPTGPTTAQTPAAAAVTSIEVSGPTQVAIGQMTRFVGTARYADGTSRDVTTTATWSSSDTTVAVVTAGTVNGVFVGSVSISAKLGEIVGVTTINVVRIIDAGIVFGPGISAVDQEMVRTAHSINERFWGPLGTTILAYQTVPEAAAAYEAMCRCSLSAQRRLELDHEGTASNPNVLLVSLEILKRFNSRQWIERLTHSEFHSVQSGYTGGRLDPTWLAEGSAEYSQVHSMANAGLVNLDQYHQFIRGLSGGYPAGLREWEMWPMNPLLPGGCMETNSCYAPYLLGHFASDLLTVRLNRSSLVAFWRETGVNQRRGMNPDSAWRTAFGSVFEISVNDFYLSFEEYRRRGFR